MRIRFMVYEIEHEGDLDDAIDAIEEHGGSVIDLAEDFEGEEAAAFLVEVEDEKAFKEKLGEDERTCL
jgi:ACT domain-containing protein